MDDRQTPTNLLDGRRWAGWGPSLDADECITPQVERLLAQHIKEPLALVRLAMAYEHCRYILTGALTFTTASAVYRAVDRKLGCEVAIKIDRDLERYAAEREVYESQSSDEEALPAVKESQIAARLRHPNIVQIVDMGQRAGWWYSVTELCDGHLVNWIFERNPNLAWAEIIRLHIEAANGLLRLHGAGYAHGDIKPANILVKDGTAKLADFGQVAMPRTVRDDKTRVCGTPGYIAPEVAVFGAGFEGDIFALAGSLWYCLFGEYPYPFPWGGHVPVEASVNASIQRAVDRKIQEPEVVPDGLPKSVIRLLRRALDPDPVVRPTLSEFVGKLQAIREQDSRRRERARRVPWVAAGVILASALGYSIRAVRGRGSGGSDESLVTVALAGMDPLTRAELAAKQGKGELAVALLYQTWSQDLPKSSQVEVAEAAVRIAAELKEAGLDDEAELAAGLAKFLQR